MPSATAVIVIAKEPVAGRVKTRLCPPLSLQESARLAAAALADTLAAVGGAGGVRRRVLAFDGSPTGWAPPGWEVIAQRGDGLGERLAAAFADVGEPALLVGMDTPQLTGVEVADGVAALGDPGVDAVFGPSLDGGYWAIGLDPSAVDPAVVFSGVPMSVEETGAAQLARLRALGLRVGMLPALRDVDTFPDALAVAAAAPASRFAAAVGAVMAPVRAAA